MASPEILESLGTNDYVSYSSDKNKYGIVLIPFNDFNGELKGYVKYVVNNEIRNKNMVMILMNIL